MTDEEFKIDFEHYIQELVDFERAYFPYDTGNLSQNAFKLVKIGEGYKIYIDLPTAPYAKSLNENNYKIHRQLDAGQSTKGFWDRRVLDMIKKIETHYGVTIEGG